MTKDHTPGLVEKALSSSESHGRSLKAVNEKLADLVASLRDQRQRLADYSRAGRPKVGGREEASMETRPTEKLATELVVAREALQRRDEEHARLRDRLAEIEVENRRVCDEYVAVQEQNAELVSLYAAIERLHGASTRDELLTAIQEIVVNVIGSEELALFEVDGDRLVPSLAFGVPSAALEGIAIGSGVVGRVAAEGRAFVAGEGGARSPPGEPQVTACVPLEVGGKVIAVLAIYGLLPHKPALTDFDRALFSLLERHAALALHFRAGERPTGAR